MRAVQSAQIQLCVDESHIGRILVSVVALVADGHSGKGNHIARTPFPLVEITHEVVIVVIVVFEGNVAIGDTGRTATDDHTVHRTGRDTFVHCQFAGNVDQHGITSGKGGVFKKNVAGKGSRSVGSNGVCRGCDSRVPHDEARALCSVCGRQCCRVRFELHVFHKETCSLVDKQ